MTLPPVDAVVDRLPYPDTAFRSAALRGPATLDVHRELAAVGALQAIELRQPERPASPHAKLTVVAWNLERCKFIEDSAARIREADADICLLTEMDIGMARSGNRHTPAELASALGMGYAFATEFIELGHGDAFETRDHAGQLNDAGLHGNAVLSRFPIEAAVRIPVDAGGGWFQDAGQSDQRRIGGRMALAGRVDVGGRKAWFVSVHLDNRLTPADRAGEMTALLRWASCLPAGEGVLLGGDLNTLALPVPSGNAGAPADDPSPHEPLFLLAAQMGFAWRSYNTGDPTLRDRPHVPKKAKIIKIDWFLGRGWTAANPRIIPALGLAGQAISDHEAIVVDLTAAAAE